MKIGTSVSRNRQHPKCLDSDTRRRLGAGPGPTWVSLCDRWRNRNDLAAVLDLWMWESPVELITSYDQIRQVRFDLSFDPNAATPTMQAIVAERDRYLGEVE